MTIVTDVQSAGHYDTDLSGFGITYQLVEPISKSGSLFAGLERLETFDYGGRYLRHGTRVTSGAEKPFFQG